MFFPLKKGHLFLPEAEALIRTGKIRAPIKMTRLCNINLSSRILLIGMRQQAEWLRARVMLNAQICISACLHAGLFARLCPSADR